MRRRRFTPPGAALAAAGLVLLAGCGRESVEVRGRLVKDGRPYPITTTGPQPETMSVDFIGTFDGVQYLLPAKFQPDGSFVVVGGDGKGIRPGRYKVAALHSGYMGEGGDRFRERFSAAKTPLTLDVTKSTEVTIDVGAGTITAVP